MSSPLRYPGGKACLLDLTANLPRDLLDLARSLGRIGKRRFAEFVEIVGIIRVSISPELLQAMADAQIDEDAEALGTRQQKTGNFVYVDRRAIEEAADLADRGDLYATLFQVEGDWYARPQGMHGVLLPLKFSIQAKLAAVHNRLFRIVGSLEVGQEGFPIGIAVEHLIPQPE